MTARIIMKMRVAASRLVAPDIVHLQLVHPLRPVLPKWSAGAHVDVRMPDGRVRQYSLCGDSTGQSSYEIAVKREAAGRGGSIWVHENIRDGSEIHVSAPRNNLPLIGGGEEYILIAGGIGITPLISMARTLKREGQRFTLHYCAKSAVHAPFLPELRDLCGQSLKCWFSESGQRFTTDLIGPYGLDKHVYICGPQRLLDAIQSSLADWPEDQVHGEVFQMTVDENFKPEPFEAKIVSTGQTLLVPANKSLLDVLRENEFALPSSCEMGVCGSCECGYRDGVVIHRDKVLPTSKRQDRMMLCVSRARVGITLEL